MSGDKPSNFWKEMDFECKNCKYQFRPDLLEDKPGHRVRVVTNEFFPPRENGGDWSPIGSSVTVYAQCPQCEEETNWLVNPIKKTAH